MYKSVANHTLIVFPHYIMLSEFIMKVWMTEKKLMTYFFLVQAADLAITLRALQIPGFSELNSFAAEMLHNGEEMNLILLKMAATLFLISAYAFAKDTDSRFSFSTEKALQIGTGLMGIVLMSNTVQVAMELPKFIPQLQ